MTDLGYFRLEWGVLDDAAEVDGAFGFRPSNPRTAIVCRIPTREEADRFFHDKAIVAVGGRDPVVDWICSGSHRGEIAVLGLVTPSTGAIARLAASPFLAQIRRLVISEPIEHGDYGPLFTSPHLASLDTLVIRNVSAPAIRELAAARLPALRALRLLRVFNRDDAIEALATLFATTVSPLEQLELEAVSVPIEAIAGNSVLAGLRELWLERCALRGVELFCALQALRLVKARYSRFDDLAAAGLARSTGITTLDLGDTNITDIGGATLVGSLRALVQLDLVNTRIGPATVDAIARLPELERLSLPEQLPYRVLEAARAASPALRGAIDWLGPNPEVPRFPLPDLDTEDIYRAVTAVESAREAHRIAVARDWWPAPPAGVTRRFVYEELEPCPNCRGYSSSTGDGWCGMHYDDKVLPRHEAAIPPDAAMVAVVACTAQRLRSAEQLAVELMESFRAKLRTIVWHFWEVNWFTTRVKPVTTAMPPPADAIKDLGYWFHSETGRLLPVSDGELHLVMYPWCQGGAWGAHPERG